MLARSVIVQESESENKSFKAPLVSELDLNIESRLSSLPSHPTGSRRPRILASGGHKSDLSAVISDI